MTDTDARPATGFDSAEHQARLAELYRDFEAAGMTPLWLTREGLMPSHPQPRAVPHLWRWTDLLPLAARSAELVPVGRGGERRAISLGNPGLPGDPYTTPTLWAAIQYLAPREDAPEHRHSQSAFRFVLQGEGVWTVVDGRPGRDAPRGPAADARLAVPRPPERLRHADGLAGRARHPAGRRNRPGLLRVRPGSAADQGHAGAEQLRTAVGRARPHPGRAGRGPARPRPWSPTAGRIPTPR